MRVNDPGWLHIAALAKVKTPHCWQIYCYMKATKGKFSVGGYAAFAGLEIHHVQRMLEVFESEGIGAPQTTAQSQAALKGEKLRDDFQMPSDWLLWAQTQRSWTLDVAKTEAERFKDYWLNKGVAGKNWLACWRNWVRGSRTPNGDNIRALAFVPKAGDTGWREHCKTQLEVATRINNITQIRMWRGELEKL